MTDTHDACPDRRTKVIWIDISDLFWFFDNSKTPSGIQRLTAEAIAALLPRSGGKVRVNLCRVDQVSGNFILVRPEELFDLFRQPIRQPAQKETAKRSQWEKAIAELRRFWVRRFRGGIAKTATALRSFHAEIDPRPGDVLLCMGSHWAISGHADLICRYRVERRLRFAFLCYDLIPLTHPHWIPKSMQEAFRSWFDAISSEADVIMTISRYTATQVQRYLAKSGRSSSVVTPIRIGHGFPATGHHHGADRQPQRFPLEIVGPFALFVSTIEARKNHSFLFRVWHRLLEEGAGVDIPQLVFVGRRGPLVDDLFQQLENTDYLDGKIVVLSDVPDSLLSWLYERCILAIYPSLEEGFGLPVAEAVSAGAICIASNKASIPEVVGDVIDYFDPDDFSAAYSLVRRALFDEDYRAELRRRADAFVPRPWSDTAEDILQAIECHASAGPRRPVFDEG